jgi:TolB-like protein/Tfp pilus assembly protein PilF
VLTHSISELRRTFQDNPREPAYIQTISKGGYRLVAPVKRSVGRESGGKAGFLKHRRWVFAIVLATAALGFSVVIYMRGRLRTSPQPDIRSIAILPLENLSRDPGQEYFADGMTEELIADISKIDALRVISRTSVMQYKGVHKPLPQIAKELNVDAVVEGSVLRSGNRVRITAELIRARSDQHLWAESYDRDLSDVLKLQTEVAQAIAHQVKVKTTEQDNVRLSHSKLVNPRAHDIYLRARAQWNKRTVESLQKSIQYFQQAIQEDPNYALAYAGMADAYIISAEEGYVPLSKAYDKIRWASSKAVELDDSIADGHIMVATVKEHDWDWTNAEREYRRAIELNPGLARAHHWYGLFLSAQKRHDEAISEVKRAVEIEPLTYSLYENVAIVYAYAHRYPEAVETINQAVGMDDAGQSVRGLIFVLQGEPDRGIKELLAGEAAAPTLNGSHLLGFAFAKAGKTKQALQIIQNLEHTPNADPVWIAVVWAGLGKRKEAFVFLDKALDVHSPATFWLAVNPCLDDLRSDGHFREYLRRMALPQ